MSQTLQLCYTTSWHKKLSLAPTRSRQPALRVTSSSLQQPCSSIQYSSLNLRSAQRALNIRAKSAASPTTDLGSGGGKGGGSDQGWGGGGSNDGFSGDSGKGDDSEGGFGWQGWKDRVAFDPEFPFKVFVEQIIGVGAAVLGDMSSRKDWGIHELDFVFSTIVVGSIMNFSLMYFLAGTRASTSRAAPNIIAKLFDDNTLKAMGAPGGNFFETGFPLSKRFLNLGYKGMVFGLVGFSAGVVGTSLSNGLIAMRKRLDPAYEAQNESPAILPNAGVWATHMGVSSNTRYQLLNGLDLVLQPRMSPTAFKAFSTAIRLSNNILGGMSFVTLAKLCRVQKSSDDA